MSVLKRYNSKTQQWEPITQAPAVGVYTDNPILTTENDPIRSVEDVLLQNHQELDLLRKNVSWLALHGGGGTGGTGGGIGINDASVQIFDPADNATEVTNIVWNSNYTNILFKVSSNTSTSTYTVYVRVNGSLKTTLYNVKRNSLQSINANAVGIGKADATISITAMDKDENEFTQTCRITIASVTISDINPVTCTQAILADGSPTLSISFKTSVAGNYKLYYSSSIIFYDDDKGWCDGDGPLEDSNTQRSQYIDVLNLGTSYTSLTINMNNIYGSTDPNNIVTLLPSNIVPGSYVRYFKLVNANNNNIYSETKPAKIVVVPAVGLLVIPTVGTSTTDRYTVTADSILYIRFVTYNGSSSTGTYSFNITVNDEQIPLDSNQSTGKTFGTTVTVPINISSYPEIFPNTGDYEIKITASQLPIQTTSTCYVTINEQSTSVVKKYLNYVNNNAILDLTFWDGTWNQNISDTSSHIQFDNENFDYVDPNLTGKQTHKAYANFYNIGADSGLAAGKGVFYKFSHTAAAKVNFDTSIRSKLFPSDNQDYNALISGYLYDFSLEVAYSLDEEVDDASTVFNLGNYDIDTGLGYGVLITAHNYYVKIDDTIMTGVMQDNSFTQFNLVCFKDKLGVRWIYVYQNGVLLQAAKHVISASGYTLSNINELTLSCRNITTVGNSAIIDYPINSHFYAVKLYNKKLNDGEIVCSYINNYANYKRDDVTGGLDPNVISSLLNYNSINSDKVVDEGGRISEVFDFTSGSYDWGVSYDGTWNLGNISDIPNKSNIPVITLTSTWSYSDFIKVNQAMVPASGTFTFITPGDGENITAEVDMEPQGTTTLGYEIKNIDITFKNNLMFSPKNTWFPEQTFTLKADVVDSAHVNNAAIGTFVNDCFNNDTDGSLFNHSAMRGATLINIYKNTKKTLPTTLTFKPTIEGFPVVLVVAFKNENSTYTTKVLGIYSFNLGRESYYNQGMKILTCLRDKNNNILQPDSAIFPGLFHTPEASDMDKTVFSCCFEGTRSMNTTETAVALESETYDYAIVTVSGVKTWYPMAINLNGYVAYDGTHYIYDDSNNLIPWNNDTVTKMKINENGYFWSPDSSFATNLFDLKYDGGDQQTAWNLFSATQDGGYGTISLCNCITRKMPYKKGPVLRDWSTQMTQWQITSSSSSDALTLVDTGKTFASERPQQPERLEISFKNAEFYYVVCMLFGLIDNFGKNMQFKYWGDGGKDSTGNYTNQYETWSPTFYDMDTALGVSNTGSEDVPPTTFDESIINLPDNKVRFLFGQAPNTLNGYPGTKANPTFTVYSNKLWGALEHAQMYENYSVDDGTTQTDWRTYAKTWHTLRTKYVTNVDDLLDKYFTKNLEKCGQFLYNYDYYTKYLNTAQYAMLHGTRITFIKNWLTARIAFLDSVFGYKANYDFTDSRLNNTTLTYLVDSKINPYNVSWNNSVNIKHNAKSSILPIKTNKSLIVQSTIGGNIYSYTYCPKNVVNNIVFADSSSAQGIQTMVNNSDCIIELPNLHNIGLLTVTHNNSHAVSNTSGRNVYDDTIMSSAPEIYYQLGSLSGLKKLDLSNISTINGAIELFKIFKTWDDSGWGGTPRAFALEELNLSNTTTSELTANLSGVTLEISDIPAIYKSPFTNLSIVDVSNSKVGSINIPLGVTLKELRVENSYVSKISLDTQPLLTEISFKKCAQLSDLVLTKCNKIEYITLDQTNVQVKNITISDCESVKSISIDAGGKWNNVPIISISNCPNLESIQIRNCYKEKYEDENVLNIVGVPNLKTLVVNNCYYTSILWDGAENLTKLSKLDISASRISRIDKKEYTNATDRNFIDLRGFKSDTFIDEEGLVQLNFKKNTNITHVYFDNVRIIDDNGKYRINVPEPFVLNLEECFGDCTNLERVYGYIHVAGPRLFNKCNKFKINGFVGNNTNTILSTKNTLGLLSDTTLGNHGDAVTFTGANWVTFNVTSGIRYYHATDIITTVTTNDNIIRYYNLLRKDSNGNFRYAWICNQPTLKAIEQKDEEGNVVNTTYEIVHNDDSTNLMISGTNVSGAFTETGCNTWDVYYTLFNCDSKNINISGLFSGCEGLDFKWIADVDPNDNLDDNIENNRNDNSPNRYTFMNCVGATSASGVFAVQGLCKIKSPYKVDENNQHWIYNSQIGEIIPGLYTPFKDNCVNLSRVVGGSVVMDNKLLRTLDDSQFSKVENISNLTCKHFVNDVNTLTYTDYTTALEDSVNWGSDGCVITGDVSDLLIDCPNVTVLDKFLNDVSFLNYNTICSLTKKIQLPKITSILNSFKTENAIGDLILTNMYTNVDDCSYLTGIYSSFRNTAAINDNIMLEFALKDDTFAKFINLEIIGIDPEDSGGEDSFTGEGLHKYVSSTDGFPYDIFKNCVKLKQLIAFFQNLDCAQIVGSFGLPGDMFLNNTELVEIPRLFYNMNTNSPAYLTNNSFINCTKLQNVSYAFACDDAGKLNAFRTVGISNNMAEDSKQPFIPNKLFYHGSSEKIKNIYGSNKTEEISGVVYDSVNKYWYKNIDENTKVTYSGDLEIIDDVNGVILINPATIIFRNGIQEYLVSNLISNSDTNYESIDDKPKFLTYTAIMPNNNITNMEGCFRGGDWGEYEVDYDNITIEDNVDYNPFKFILNNKVWTRNNQYSPCKQTYMWVYDGDWKKYRDYVGEDNVNTYEMMDDGYGCNNKNYRMCRSVLNLNYPHLEMDLGGKSTALELTGKFCFAPDLLRYCSPTANIKSLFANCGPRYHKYSKSDSIRYGSDAQVQYYGLKGRLVPYLLKPVSTISSMSGMFTNCKFICSYTKDNINEDGSVTTYAYPIPESFMQYLSARQIDLTNTFSGWYYPANTNLNVFKRNNTVVYKLINAFKWPLFSNRICTVNGNVAEAYVNFPASIISGIFNDGTGYTRAGEVGGVFNLSEQDSDNESNTNLVRNQSVQFSSIFNQTGYTLGTDSYCFAGYTEPSVEEGLRFPSKSVRTDKDYRNYVVYNGDPF